MNDVPLHALRAGGKRLYRAVRRQLCGISEPLSPGPCIRCGGLDRRACHPARRGTDPAYEGTIRAMAAEGSNIPVAIPDPTWQNFKTRWSRVHRRTFLRLPRPLRSGRPTQQPPRSHADEPVDFSRLFSDLDLRGLPVGLHGGLRERAGPHTGLRRVRGLPTAFFAAAFARAGDLVEVNQLAAAIVVAKHYSLLHKGDRSVVASLNEAVRQTMAMSRDEVIAWVRAFIPEKAAAWEKRNRQDGRSAVRSSVLLAGFFASGDV